MAAEIAEYVVGSDIAKQLAGSALESYCCTLGTPCDCKRPMNAPGQCSSAAYAACCLAGNVQCDIPAPKDNCHSNAWQYCCSFGTPCDCTRPRDAGNQCNAVSYEYCCDAGTSCDCTKPAWQGGGA